MSDVKECQTCRYYDDYNEVFSDHSDSGAELSVSVICDGDDGYGHDKLRPEWYLLVESAGAIDCDCDYDCGMTMYVPISYCPDCGRKLC